MSATTAGIVLLAAGAALATLTAWAWWTDAHPATGRHHATTRWQRARSAWHATTGWARARRENARRDRLRPLPPEDAETVAWVHEIAQPPPFIPPAAWLAAAVCARSLVREAERLATRPWAEETGAFARAALTDMLAGAV